MKKNDIIQLEITDLSVQGEGIGRFDGVPFFVQGACPGDTVSAGITKLKKTYGYARLLELLSPSSDRTAPPCPIASKCGGCTLMHVSYDRQLSWKEEMVYNSLLRIGGLPSAVLDEAKRPIVGMNTPLHYRNKSQYPVAPAADGSAAIGFYAARSHRIIPLPGTEYAVSKTQAVTPADAACGCQIAHPLDIQILQIIKHYMRRFHIVPYDEKTGEGLIRHILIRHAFATKEVMICAVVNGNMLPHKDALCDSLQRIQGIRSIVLNENRRRDNVILGENTLCLWGSDSISDILLENRFRISARSFYQVNPVMTEQIYQKAIEYASLSGSETVWDLYCGIGTISLCMAKHAKRVLGIEVVPDAIRDAKKNAEINGIDNAVFIAAKAEDLLQMPESGTESDFSDPDIIVVDPPRKGLAPETIRLILAARPERLVYISCNPATLARDLKEITGAGYRLLEYTPFDAFCFSGHVECACSLQKTG